ncbi:hypothetical protein [Lignipirellula cremea]|uniref:hypothetical protein n=1 Tax=Lignipirellula cremea TaxID=2528010 RepID=UPI0011A8FBE5|nr:hypothetical protein [Lignipirellula cremea]
MTVAAVEVFDSIERFGRTFSGADFFLFFFPTTPACLTASGPGHKSLFGIAQEEGLVARSTTILIATNN